MEVVNATSEDGFGVLKSLSDSETEKFTDKFISDLKALISVETDNSIDEEERKEAIEEININLGVMFEYERERDIFIRKLKDGFSDWMQRFSTYYWDGCKFISGNLSSPEILFGIRKLLENNKSDFANAIREAGIELAQEELKASKSAEIMTIIGNDDEAKLQNEINQLNLQNAIVQTRFENSESKENELFKLQDQFRKKEISPVEYSKQKQIIELNIEADNLRRELQDAKYLWKWGEKEAQLASQDVTEECVEAKSTYILKNLEIEKIHAQLAFLNGEISPQEYSEELRGIDKRIENHLRINAMNNYFPQENTFYDDQTVSKGGRGR